MGNYAREASVLFIHFIRRKASEVDIHPHLLKASGKKTEHNVEKKSMFSRIQLLEFKLPCCSFTHHNSLRYLSFWSLTIFTDIKFSEIN